MQEMLAKLHEHQKLLSAWGGLPPGVGNPIPIEICTELLELQGLSEQIDVEYIRLMKEKWYGVQL